MKLKKNNLDEQQERKLLEIESCGFWLAFWGLLVAMAVEMLIFEDTKAVICEWVLFICLSLYLCICCIRAGIWDRRLDMSPKTCLIMSLIAALCAAVFLFGFTFLRFHRPVGSLFAAAISGLILLPACYAALILAARATKKRQDELNAEPADE